MRAMLLLSAIIATFSVAGAAFLNGYWWFGAGILVVPVSVVLFDRWLALRRRDKLVRRIVRQTIGFGGDRVYVSTLVAALKTEDVQLAYEEARRNEEALWVTRNRSER